MLTVTKSASAIECVIYARQVTDFSIHGNAWTWWSKAHENGYKTGRHPEPGSVVVFKRIGDMRLGHVAVVRKIVSKREVVVDHANWSAGVINRNISVIDVSPRNDWSRVRVWYPPVNGYGYTVYPIYGFIYDHHRHHRSRSSAIKIVEKRPAISQHLGEKDMIPVSAHSKMLSDRFGVSVLLRDGKPIVMGHPVVSRGDRVAVPWKKLEMVRRATKEKDTAVIQVSVERAKKVHLPVMPTLRPVGSKAIAVGKIR